jgi:hypothetical protein
LLSALLLSFNVNSATIAYNLSGTVITTGPFFGSTGSGSFSYDDSFVTGSGTETINPSSSLKVHFTIFNQSFTEANDLDAAFGAPDLTLIDGVPVFLDFYLSELADGASTNIVSINEPGIIEIDTWNLSGINLTQITDGFEVTVSVSAVPIPATFWLFGSGLVGLIGLMRRKT